MKNSSIQTLNSFIQGLEKRNPNQIEFIQAVKEFVSSTIEFISENKIYQEHYILERMTEPERIISFRIPWVDDQNNIRMNRGYRVQFNNSIGPYKGGTRFHPSVNESILKFLAFEQTFKNSLTTLPMGSGKGGANFNPKGKSESEIMRFCQSYMIELAKYIGPHHDIPAGDIGVGGREIGYMFGMYKRLKLEYEGVLTGKPLEIGGSLIRPEATGYGTIYFAENVLNNIDDSLKDKTCLISGSGNVAQFSAEKLISYGAKVLTFSDSSGTIYDKDGIDQEKLEFVKELKNIHRERISKYVEQYPQAEFFANQRPWHIPADIAIPSATQNEIEIQDAKKLVNNNCKFIVEAANMPSTLEAMKYFNQNNVLFAPSKAANAGGVAVSGLEMSQNSLRLAWSREEVDQKLKDIMQKIHQQCLNYGQIKEKIDYVKGANIAGFVKVADAMIVQGVI